MHKIKSAVAWALAVADDPAHGYDQAKRWGPDYDCASLVIAAWEAAGVPVREAGAGWTGNMKRAFLDCGFADVTAQIGLAAGSGLQPGDVLLREDAHAAMAVGGGRIVAARINERGAVTGGTPGDQTGREICRQDYYNFPWDCVLRYREPAETSPEPDPAPAPEITGASHLAGLPTLAQGRTGWTVRSAQGMLIAQGYACGPDGADGDFGPNTRAAVCRFQRACGLAADGVVGDKTWTRLLLGKGE